MGKSDSVDIEVYYCNHLILKYNGSSPSIIFQHHPCVFTILGFLHCRRGHKQGLALGSIDLRNLLKSKGHMLSFYSLPFFAGDQNIFEPSYFGFKTVQNVVILLCFAPTSLV